MCELTQGKEIKTTKTLPLAMLIPFTRDEVPLIKYHHHYLHTSKVSLNSIITGDSFLRMGCGKSYTALRLAELIDPDFGIHKVVYHPIDYLKVMKEIEQSGKKGQVVVVDEGEVTANSALWQSIRNKAIGINLAVGRYLQCMGFFVSPTFGWLDKRIRVLANHLGSTSKVVTSGGTPTVNLKYRRLTTNEHDERLWFKNLRMFSVDAQQIVKFKQFKVSLPSEDLICAYEKKAISFKSDLLSEYIKLVGEFDAKEEEKQVKFVKPKLQELASKALDKPLIREMLQEKGKVTNNLVRNEFIDEGLSINQSSQLKALIETTWRGK